MKRHIFLKISLLLVVSLKIAHAQTGNVGIGTTTPNAKLHVYGSGIFQIPPPVNSNEPYGLALRPVSGSSPTGFAPLLLQNLNGQTVFGLSQEWGAGDRSIFFNTDNYDNGASLAIRMAIDRLTGNVGIGTGLHDPLSRLDVRGTTKIMAGPGVPTGNFWNGTSNVSGFEVSTDPATLDVWVGIQRAGTAAPLHVAKPAGTASGQLINFDIGGTGIGSISHIATSVVYNTTSDFRLKENFRSSHYGLSTVKAMQVYDYNFKIDRDKNISTGLMAQDLYKLYPQAVTVGGDNAATDPWQVDYSKLTPVLIKAVQELNGKMETLEQTLQEKDRQIAELQTTAITVAQLIEEVNKLKQCANK